MMLASQVWYASRAGGLVSYTLLWASVIWGILASSRPFSSRLSNAAVLDWHRILSIAALAFGTLHAGVLLLDKHSEFGLGDLLVPLHSNKSPVATAMGVIALELGLAIAISVKFRKYMGVKAWRQLHMLSYPVFVLAFAHSVAMGTDARNSIVMGVLALSGLCVVFATAFRVIYRPGGERQVERQRVRIGSAD